MKEELCFMPKHQELGEEDKEITASLMRCCISSLPAVLSPFSDFKQHKFIILFSVVWKSDLGLTGL